MESFYRPRSACKCINSVQIPYSCAPFPALRLGSFSLRSDTTDTNAESFRSQKEMLNQIAFVGV